MKRNKFSIKKDAWEKLEKNSVAIALNGLFANICPAYVSRYNSNR